MCLKLNLISFRRKAKKDIIVYKLLEVRYNLRGEEFYVTPYRYAKAKMGETYKSQLIPIYESLGILPFIERSLSVGIHSYIKYEDVLNRKDRYTKIAKCIIPKGSYYYKGRFGKGGSRNYASDTLQYLEIVKN